METLRCRYFYFLWLLMFCNIIPITLLTSAYKVRGELSTPLLLSGFGRFSEPNTWLMMPS